MNGLENMYTGDRLQSSQHETFGTYKFIQMHAGWLAVVSYTRRPGFFTRCQLIHMKTNNLRSSLTATHSRLLKCISISCLVQPWSISFILTGVRSHATCGRPVHPSDQKSSHFHVVFFPWYVYILIVHVHCCFIRHTEKLYLMIFMNSASALNRTASFSKG